MAEYDYQSFSDFSKGLQDKFPEIARLAAIPALEDASTYLLEQVPEYPMETTLRIRPPDGTTWLRTPKQRRWFFAAVKSGEVAGWQMVDGHPEKVGGGRSGNLGRAQGYNIVSNDDGVLSVLGFDKMIAPYAPWVVGSDFPGAESGDGVKYQARIHVDRWWQFAEIIEENIQDAWEVFDTTFWKKFDEYLRGRE